MTLVDLIISLLLIAASFCLPVIAVRVAPKRTGPVPATEHLTVEQQRGLRRRFLRQARFWIISVGAFVLATAVTSVIFLVPARPGMLVLATMLGVPYVVAVAAAMYLLHPLWHRTVTDELKRLGELRNCPNCSYDLSELTGRVCPECGAAARNR